MVKIDHYSQVQPLIKTDQQSQTSQSKTSVTVTAAPEAQAAISSTTQAVQQAFEQLQQQSEVDLDKVAKIKLALSEGSLQLDDDVLVQSMLDFHKK
ncbi:MULTISPECIES: flagellar biosynthesis anti-sigma factor FlgM [Rheinheimera]|jgi:negative regulator of flagellin synthesis FlgM|uniref:flagellar biosynthesis anti-sigma factor FlgM n=1 Tax=Rheinheimera TaxID=67575 RepID=UPI001E495C0A|nr:MULTISPECIES: flagellar biosynthesis anti-sigma factor FlgM [Rheinheimera]HJS15962.1 flagellar biosynthesis anti-sigma factor FlgM [Rheinheimera sp.]